MRVLFVFVAGAKEIYEVLAIENFLIAVSVLELFLIHRALTFYLSFRCRRYAL